MQIICNDCYSGFLNRLLDRQFENPFYWSRIYAKDFYNLLEKYEKLNYNDIEIKLNKDFTNEFKLWTCDAFSPVIICDGIRIFYNHYKYNQNDKVPRIEIPDVYYYKNYEYCYEKWIKRSKRITKEKPLVIFHYNDRTNDKNEEVLKIFELCKKKDYKLIFISDVPISGIDNKNIFFIQIKNVCGKEVEEQVKETFNQIKSFINE